MSEMSEDQQGQVEEPEWPTHCDLCGTELETGVLGGVLNSDSEHLQTGSPATVIAQDFCPNEDCPGKVADAT